MRLILVLLTFLFVLSTACGSGGSSSDTPNPPPPMPEPKPEPEPEPEPETPDGSASASAMVDFVLPWNDASAGISNMGARLNHKPAGQFGSLAVNGNGHFSLNGERVRFWGVNITGESCFPTAAEAEAIAGRLAKFGVNLVRFHHMDNNWGGLSLIDYSQGNSRHLDSEALARLDYFVAQLKAQGIYVNFNLINAREFATADGLPGAIEDLGWKQRHVFGFFMPAMRDLEKEYARQLLEHTNRHTGLSYAADPAIAFVEINNENSLFQQYFDGSMDAWPETLKAELRTEWNGWLSARYDSTEAIESAWGAVEEPLGSNLIVNANFSSGIENWQLEEHQGAQASATTGSYASRQGVRVTVDEPGSANWHVQFHQPGLALTESQLYTLSFWHQTDNLNNISVALQQAYDPWGTLESRSLDLSGDWQQFQTSFFAPSTDDNLRLNFTGLGNQQGSLYLANVELQPGGSIGQLPDDQTLEAGTVAINNRSDGYTESRTRDWMTFLRDLEQDYWADMHAHIKQTLAFNGLVTGTQLMNSPPSVQNEFPFIDAHAYWQHPVFPGADWDMNNWIVNNESMVNRFANTIPQLSGQRVAGKPFTVSEYQHSSPNTYSSEAPLLIAAYGALQDWDGIYLFSYDKGAGDSWSPRYFSNFFSMNAHPSKMANMAIAANLFRRGDIAAAEEQVLLNFTPERELDILTNRGSAWNVANASHLDTDPKLAFQQRVALAASADPTGSAQPPAAPDESAITSSTGQLTWDLSRAGKGVTLVDSPRSKAVIGFIDGRRFQLGEVAIDVGETDQDWATVALSAQGGSLEAGDAAANLLLVTTGLTVNTDMEWLSPERNSVGSDWGRAPSRVEVVPATIELPWSAARVSAWTLNQTGQRLAELEVYESESGSRLELTGDTDTLWYEIQVSAVAE